MALRWFTAGESHGPQLTVLIEGLPAGLEIAPDDLRKDLARRQGGHGRGGRQQIETDAGRFVGGVRGAYLSDSKHVNQQIYTAAQFAAWRGL